MASSFSSTTYYEREWRDSSPSRRIFDHHRHFGPGRLLDDPFFRRTPFSGSLESLRTAGLNGTNNSSPAAAETKYSYSYSNSSAKSEEKAYKDEKSQFMVTLDLAHFNPDEIKVTVHNDTLLVDASHDEKRDQHGFVTRMMKRKYPLPKDVDVERFVSELTKDGLLTVKAPKIDVHQKMKERAVPVHVVTTGAGGGLKNGGR